MITEPLIQTTTRVYDVDQSDGHHIEVGDSGGDAVVDLRIMRGGDYECVKEIVLTLGAARAIAAALMQTADAIDRQRVA